MWSYHLAVVDGIYNSCVLSIDNSAWVREGSGLWWMCRCQKYHTKQLENTTVWQVESFFFF